MTTSELVDWLFRRELIQHSLSEIHNAQRAANYAFNQLARPEISLPLTSGAVESFNFWTDEAYKQLERATSFQYRFRTRIQFYLDSL